MAQAENCCQNLDQATATGRCSTFHGHYIIHALASKRNVVCTRSIYLPGPHCDESIFNTDMWLSQKHCFIGRRCYTVPCKSHRGHTFRFYQSERVEHAQVLARAKRAQVLVYIHAMGYQLAISLISNWAGYIVAIHRPGVR